MPRDDAMADWTYAADAAQAAWLALNAPELPHRLYNVGAERRPVGEFTRAMRKLHPVLFQVHQARFRVRLERSPVHPVLLRELLGLVRVVQAEVSNSLLLVRPKIHSRSSAWLCRTAT